MTSKKAANPVNNSFRRGMTGNLAMRHGRFFDDFEPGQTFSHWPGRTVTEADDIWFSLLTQNQNPLHIDAHYAANRGPHYKPLVNGTLVFAIAVGQTVADISLNAIANLDYEQVTHEAPVFHGDSIYTASTILSVRLTSRKDRGIVKVETVAKNQQGVRVLSFRRNVLLPCAPD